MHGAAAHAVVDEVVADDVDAVLRRQRLHDARELRLGLVEPRALLVGADLGVHRAAAVDQDGQEGLDLAVGVGLVEERREQLLDLRGQQLFMDIADQPDRVRAFFAQIEQVIGRFTELVGSNTGSTSISVNRTVRHRLGAVFLHSECTHTMISQAHYEEFLLPFDAAWSRRHQPFGIHYCGPDPHRFAAAYAKVPRLDFLDVGWGGDLRILRQHLPNTFLNIRLSPVEIVSQTPEQIVAAAVQEDADVIAMSVLSGAHNYLFPRVMELVKEKGITDVLVMGGGIIPDEDIPPLKTAGIAAIFGPGTDTSDIIGFIRENVRKN